MMRTVVTQSFLGHIRTHKVNFFFWSSLFFYEIKVATIITAIDSRMVLLLLS
jgi:hypothetical protein